MYKKAGVLLLVLVLLSYLAIAQSNESSWFSSVGKFLWGSSDRWFDRGALVGEAGGQTTTKDYSILYGGRAYGLSKSQYSDLESGKVVTDQGANYQIVNGNLIVSGKVEGEPYRDEYKSSGEFIVPYKPQLPDYQGRDSISLVDKIPQADRSKYDIRWIPNTPLAGAYLKPAYASDQYTSTSESVLINKIVKDGGDSNWYTITKEGNQFVARKKLETNNFNVVSTQLKTPQQKVDLTGISDEYGAKVAIIQNGGNPEDYNYKKTTKGYQAVLKEKEVTSSEEANANSPPSLETLTTTETLGAKVIDANNVEYKSKIRSYFGIDDATFVKDVDGKWKVKYFGNSDGVSLEEVQNSNILSAEIKLYAKKLLLEQQDEEQKALAAVSKQEDVRSTSRSISPVPVSSSSVWRSVTYNKGNENELTINSEDSFRSADVKSQARYLSSLSKERQTEILSTITPEKKKYIQGFLAVSDDPAKSALYITQNTQLEKNANAEKFTVKEETQLFGKSSPTVEEKVEVIPASQILAEVKLPSEVQDTLYSLSAKGVEDKIVKYGGKVEDYEIEDRLYGYVAKRRAVWAYDDATKKWIESDYSASQLSTASFELSKQNNQLYVGVNPPIASKYLTSTKNIEKDSDLEGSVQNRDKSTIYYFTDGSSVVVKEGNIISSSVLQVPTEKIPVEILPQKQEVAQLPVSTDTKTTNVERLPEQVTTESSRSLTYTPANELNPTSPINTEISTILKDTGISTPSLGINEPTPKLKLTINNQNIELENNQILTLQDGDIFTNREQVQFRYSDGKLQTRVGVSGEWKDSNEQDLNKALSNKGISGDDIARVVINDKYYSVKPNTVTAEVPSFKSDITVGLEGGSKEIASDKTVVDIGEISSNPTIDVELRSEIAGKTAMEATTVQENIKVIIPESLTIPSGGKVIPVTDQNLQNTLQALGYTQDDPRDRIKAYQKDRGLNDDAIVGTNTVEKLNLDLQNRNSLIQKTGGTYASLGLYPTSGNSYARLGDNGKYTLQDDGSIYYESGDVYGTYKKGSSNIIDYQKPILKSSENIYSADFPSQITIDSGDQIPPTDPKLAAALKTLGYGLITDFDVSSAVNLYQKEHGITEGKVDQKTVDSINSDLASKQFYQIGDVTYRIPSEKGKLEYYENGEWKPSNYATLTDAEAGIKSTATLLNPPQLSSSNPIQVQDNGHIQVKSSTGGIRTYLPVSQQQANIDSENYLVYKTQEAGDNIPLYYIIKDGAMVPVKKNTLGNWQEDPNGVSKVFTAQRDGYALETDENGKAIAAYKVTKTVEEQQAEYDKKKAELIAAEERTSSWYCSLPLACKKPGQDEYNQLAEQKQSLEVAKSKILSTDFKYAVNGKSVRKVGDEYLYDDGTKVNDQDYGLIKYLPGKSSTVPSDIVLTSNQKTISKDNPELKAALSALGYSSVDEFQTQVMNTKPGAVGPKTINAINDELDKKRSESVVEEFKGEEERRVLVAAQADVKKAKADLDSARGCGIPVIGSEICSEENKLLTEKQKILSNVLNNYESTLEPANNNLVVGGENIKPGTDFKLIDSNPMPWANSDRTFRYTKDGKIQELVNGVPQGEPIKIEDMKKEFEGREILTLLKDDGTAGKSVVLTAGTKVESVVKPTTPAASAVVAQSPPEPAKKDTFTFSSGDNTREYQQYTPSDNIKKACLECTFYQGKGDKANGLTNTIGKDKDGKLYSFSCYKNNVCKPTELKSTQLKSEPVEIKKVEEKGPDENPVAQQQEAVNPSSPFGIQLKNSDLQYIKGQLDAITKQKNEFKEQNEELTKQKAELTQEKDNKDTTEDRKKEIASILEQLNKNEASLLEKQKSLSGNEDYYKELQDNPDKLSALTQDIVDDCLGYGQCPSYESLNEEQKKYFYSEEAYKKQVESWTYLASQSTGGGQVGSTIMNLGKGKVTVSNALKYSQIFQKSVKTYPNIENAIFKNDKNYQAWQAGVDKLFANIYLGGWVETVLCAIRPHIEPGEAVLMIEEPSGMIQSIASVQAERSRYANNPLLCSQEVPCAKYGKIQPICKDDGFCYTDESATEPLRGYFYKITWAVQAPQDAKQTLLTDEARQEIDFNLQLRGKDNRWLFGNERTGRGSENTVHLGLGNHSRNLELPPVIVEYNPEEFKQICIVFGDNKPKDYRGRPLGVGSPSVGPFAVFPPAVSGTQYSNSEICATFKISEIGKDEYQTIISNPVAVPGAALMGALFGQNLPTSISPSSVPNLERPMPSMETTRDQETTESRGGKYCGMSGCS